MLGYSVGALALVILLSALNGFETTIFSSYKYTDPDLLLSPQTGLVFSPSNKQLQKLQQIPDISVVSGVFLGKAIVHYGEQQTVCTVVGVDTAFNRRILLDSIVTAGTVSFFDPKRDKVGALADMTLLSEGLVYRLGVGKIDAPISLMVVDKQAGLHSVDALRVFDFIPSAVVRLPEEQNNQTVYIALEKAHELFGTSDGNYPNRGNEITQLEFRLHDGIGENRKKVERVKKDILAVLSNQQYTIKNPQEQHLLLYKMFNTEKWISFSILAFVLLLISFNLLGALTLMVIDKRNDFLLLSHMGLKKSAIWAVVFWEGVWISVGGTIIGIVLGSILVILQQKFGFITTQGTLTISYPVELRSADMLLILLFNSGLGIVSALIPAWRAGKVCDGNSEEQVVEKLD